MDTVCYVRYTEGFRTPALGRRAGPGAGAGVRKPRKGETAGRKRRGLAGRDLWGFEGRGRIADVAAGAEGGRRCRRERHDGPFRGRGCEQRVWERRRESVRGGREDIGLLLRRVAGGAARRGCVGMRGDGHEVSILMRVGDGGRPGRAPSKVSTMIIRPPQQGQRRAGETVSAWLFASACERSGAASGAASAWRTRSMLLRPNRAGEEAVVADAVEAARQDVQEKAADVASG